ncbi:anthrone oxygenase family protein [Actinoplanes sp. NPDC048796]|uniref:anthrone oxygenase family protein n=1 Tax=unclassified Actinoplanes TaxID=2626549 RepID=UPI0033F8688D
MWIWVLSVLGVVAAGLAAGVLFGVALANVPGFAAMPAASYVRVHQSFDRRYEPTMPILVLGAAAADLALAVLAEPVAARVLFALGAVLLVVVALVSQLRNVPLLATSVRQADPDRLPPAWSDPRPRWRQWHLVRTASGVAGFAVTVAAVINL